MTLDLKSLKTEIDRLEPLVEPASLRSQIKLAQKHYDPVGWVGVPTEEIIEYEHMVELEKLWRMIIKDYEDLVEFYNEFVDSADPFLLTMYNDIWSFIKQIREDLEFTGKYDRLNALISIQAGAGGKEAQDWALMLFNMYCGWARKHEFETRVLDWHDGEDSTVLKSATIEINGKNAYGLLQHEMGVHRLIRVSPFDAKNRRHTSFAAVEVLPAVELDTAVSIDPKDLQIDTMKSSGKGGQHVNKTESAIRITHLPTGIVVACQSERSQVQNKDKAMKMLIAKLVAIKEQNNLQEIAEIQGEQLSISWGSQIRTYTFMPFQLVKDHRTNQETSNIEAVMSGEIDAFITNCRAIL